MQGSAPRVKEYEIEALDEPCMVEAESFKCVKFVRENMENGERKRFWFAAGVGKVREQNLDDGKIEVLIEYNVP